MTQMKKCVACEEEKSLSRFYKNAKAADGHGTWCKECWSKRKEMLAVIAARKHKCAACDELKSRSEFRWNPKFGLRTECKECEKSVIRCGSCKELKTLDQFPASKKMSNGLYGICMACWSQKVNEKYHADPNRLEKKRKLSRSKRAVAWRRQYYSRPDIKERDRTKHSANTNWMYHNDVLYRLKVKARSAVDHALKTGKIVKPESCQSNGRYGVVCEGRLEAHHHHGYWPRAAWIDVEWLCVACHKSADEKLDKSFSIVFRDPGNPVYAAIAKRVDSACEMLGISEDALFSATLACAGEDECDTFLKVVNWLKSNGYKIKKE